MIYFMQGTETKNIKIGRTDKPVSERFNKWASSDVLTCLTTIEGHSEEEGIIHVRFARLSLHGEWFKPAPELIEYINSLPKSKWSGWTQPNKPSWSPTIQLRIEQEQKGDPAVLPRITGLIKHAVEYDGLWRAVAIFKCSICPKKHREVLKGTGSLPTVFTLTCRNTGASLEVVNW